MTPREIYLKAMEKIAWQVNFNDWDEQELKKALVNISDGTRQTKEARIARKALKDATYARLSGY
jgi:hypothetical protein